MRQDRTTARGASALAGSGHGTASVAPSVADALRALALSECEQGVLVESACRAPADAARRHDWSQHERAEALQSLAHLELIDLAGGEPVPSQAVDVKVLQLVRQSQSACARKDAEARAAMHRSILDRLRVCPLIIDTETLEDDFSRLSAKSTIILNAYPYVLDPQDSELVARDVAFSKSHRAAGRTAVDLVAGTRLAVSFEADYFGSLAAIHQVRVGEALLRLALLDAEVAVIPRDPHDHVQGALVTRDPDAVAYVGLLMSQLMAGAVPYQRANRLELSERQRVIVGLLAAGLTDEAIARRTGVTDRTVRRSIAELLEMFDVSSRFALGVEAAKQGVI